MRLPAPLIALFLLMPIPLHGQDAPLACTAAIEGITACMADKLCLCRFDPGGSMTGRPARHRWDCGINRPACAPPPQASVPIDLPPLILAPPRR